MSAAGAEASNVTVRVEGYSGNWVPTVDGVRSLEYTSDRAGQLADALYFHDHLETALSTVRLAQGGHLPCQRHKNSTALFTPVRNAGSLKPNQRPSETSVSKIICKEFEGRRLLLGNIKKNS